MIPIQDLLNKIKWDKNEKPEEYSIFYLDRVLNRLIEVRYTDIIRTEGLFFVIIRDGEEATIPMHRIKKMLKGDETVWQRS